MSQTPSTAQFWILKGAPSIPNKYSLKSNSTNDKEKRSEERIKEVFIKNVLKFFKVSDYSILNKSSTFV